MGLKLKFKKKNNKSERDSRGRESGIPPLPLGFALLLTRTGG